MCTEAKPKQDCLRPPCVRVTVCFCVLNGTVDIDSVALSSFQLPTFFTVKKVGLQFKRNRAPGPVESYLG
jgi:hypothetical protein